MSTWRGVVVGILFLALTAQSAAADMARPQELVDKARLTIDSLVSDPDLSWFRANVKNAMGLLIVPQLLKGAFFVGGAGGSGVLLIRDLKTGEWSEPAFYTIGAASFGLQFGGEASELVLMVMTRKGIEPLYRSSVKLGVDASAAVGPVGGRVEGATATNLSADYLCYARSKGAFFGVSLEGAVIAARDNWNRIYYGKPVKPVDILAVRSVTNPKADGLRAAVAKATETP